MRATGATYTAIAKALGVTDTTAQKYVHRVDYMIHFQATQLQNTRFGPSPRVRFWDNLSGEDQACLALGYSEPHLCAWPWSAPKPRSLWQRGPTRVVHPKPTVRDGPTFIGAGL